MAYKITQAPRFLYDTGVNYYETGTLKKNGVALFDYYRTDGVTTEQKSKILKWCKDARFFGSSKSYAPEIKSCMIAFPKAGFYRVGFND